MSSSPNLFTGIDPSEELFEKIDRNFPSLSLPLDAALSACAELYIKNISLPSALFFVGPPSSYKTVVIDIIKAVSGAYYLDDFTPASFVSHLHGVSQNTLQQQIDLLPKIKQKVLLVPEMNVVWSQSKERLTNNIGIMTRVLDGQGYTSHSGVHGTRGYDEKTMFVWLAGTTPIPRHVWELVGKLGSRLYFYPVGDRAINEDDIVEMIKGEKSHGEKIAECKSLIIDFVTNLRKKYPQGIEWSTKNDDDAIIRKIASYAELLARLRASIEIEYDKSGNFEVGKPLIENPSRAATWLYNLAKGHALIHGREQVTEDDIPVIAKIALSSAPYDRVVAMKVFAKSSITNLDDMAEALDCTKKPAMRIARILEALGMVELRGDPQGNAGRPKEIVVLNGKYHELVKGGFT